MLTLCHGEAERVCAGRYVLHAKEGGEVWLSHPGQVFFAAIDVACRCPDGMSSSCPADATEHPLNMTSAPPGPPLEDWVIRAIAANRAEYCCDAAGTCEKVKGCLQNVPALWCFGDSMNDLGYQEIRCFSDADRCYTND